jgi:hypothetical protein
MPNHPTLDIIIGGAAAGKSSLACMMAFNKITVFVTPKTILSEAVTSPKVRSAEVMIIDECEGEGSCRMLQQIWGTGRIGYVKPGQDFTYIPTPNVIAIFQEDQISESWLQRFKVAGATITKIERKDARFVASVESSNGSHRKEVDYV